jgi:hypothetical protein
MNRRRPIAHLFTPHRQSTRVYRIATIGGVLVGAAWVLAVML